MHVVFFSVLLAVICLYALLRGGMPERAVAVIFIVAAFVTRAVGEQSQLLWKNPEFGLLLIDVIMLVALVLVALRANRFWPLHMASLQLVLVAVHVVKILNPDTLRWVYAVLIGLWSYPMLVLLAWGTFRHRRRLRSAPDMPWSRSLLPLRE